MARSHRLHRNESAAYCADRPAAHYDRRGDEAGDANALVAWNRASPAFPLIFDSVLRWAHGPLRRARHAHAPADASRSGVHTGCEECAMPAWLHSEWRLLHAYVPACSGPAKASLSGKRDFKTRDEGTETASLTQSLLCRDRALARALPIGGDVTNLRKTWFPCECVVDLRGFELRARHAVISNPSLRHRKLLGS
jgi:hypothetical protein